MTGCEHYDITSIIYFVMVLVVVMVGVFVVVVVETDVVSIAVSIVLYNWFGVDGNGGCCCNYAYSDSDGVLFL